MYVCVAGSTISGIWTYGAWLVRHRPSMLAPTAVTLCMYVRRSGGGGGAAVGHRVQPAGHGSDRAGRGHQGQQPKDTQRAHDQSR